MKEFQISVIESEIKRLSYDLSNKKRSSTSKAPCGGQRLTRDRDHVTIDCTYISYTVPSLYAYK